jgi:hypothetical protein
MLFDNKECTRTAPKKPGEDDFSFYDSSGRPEFQIYRDLLNGWIAEFPESERAETIARLQKNDSLGYQAALAELTTTGLLVEVHPACVHPTRKSDFLAKDKDGKPVGSGRNRTTTRGCSPCAIQMGSL